MMPHGVHEHSDHHGPCRVIEAPIITAHLIHCPQIFTHKKMGVHSTQQPSSFGWVANTETHVSNVKFMNSFAKTNPTFFCF